MGSFDHLSDDDPRVIEHERRENMSENYECGPVRVGTGTKEFQELQAENARLKNDLKAAQGACDDLRAELKKIKPKPILETVAFRVHRNAYGQRILQEHIEGNLEVIFDGDIIHSVQFKKRGGL